MLILTVDWLFNKMYHNTSQAFIVELWSDLSRWSNYLLVITVNCCIKSISHLGLCRCTEYKQAKISSSLQPQGFDCIDVLIFSRTALLIQICLIILSHACFESLRKDLHWFCFFMKTWMSKKNNKKLKSIHFSFFSFIYLKNFKIFVNVANI